MRIKEVGYIVERLADRFRDLGGQMASQEAAHKAELVEFLASFNARTGADEKIIEGLRIQVQDMRAEIERLRALLRKDVEDCYAEAITVPGELAKDRDSLRRDNAQLRKEHDADLTAIVGLLSERDKLREEVSEFRVEVSALQERLRASIARGDFAEIEVACLKAHTPKYKVGDKLEWQKLGLSPCSVTVTGIRLVYDCIGEGSEYPTGYSEDELRAVASHDTPAGKEAA